MSGAISSLVLQNTARDSIITYMNDFLKKPIVIQAAGEDDILTFDGDGEVETVVVKKTADGVMTVAIKPALISGKIAQQWNSSSRLSLAAIQNTQNSAGLIVVGTLNIANPAGLWDITLPNVILTTVPTAPNLKRDGVQPVSISFTCDLPTTVDIGSIASTAFAVLNAF